MIRQRTYTSSHATALTAGAVLTPILASLCFALHSPTSLADCGVGSTEKQEILNAFPAAQAMDKAGKSKQALALYVRAQAYLCGPNANETAAAQRAAQIAAPLALAEEKKGNIDEALRLYEMGAHYAAADRMLLAKLRANPDSPAMVRDALTHIELRQQPAFTINNAARLRVTGVYTPDAKIVAEIVAAPRNAAERAFQREALAFDEQYLKDSVQRIQSRPEATADMSAYTVSQQREIAFAQKWPTDLLKTGASELTLVHEYAYITHDENLRAALLKQRSQRFAQRAQTLAQNYSGAPELLTTAIDFQVSATEGETEAMRATRIDPIKKLALQLGDGAAAKQRYLLAADYYKAADERAKADAAKEQHRLLDMQHTKPDMAAMTQQAEAMKKSMSNPETIRALKAQAEAMRKLLQADPAAARRVSADGSDASIAR